MDPKRRLVNYSLLALVGTGGYFTAGTLFGSLEPPKKALLEAATLIDTTTLPPNTVSFFSWLKKPIFIFKHDASVPFDPKRDVAIGAYHYTIMVGICTHLGCVPKYEEEAKEFVCPCHQGYFDLRGYALRGPVSKPLEIPPFDVQGELLLIGQAGEAYTQLMEANG